MCQLGGCFVSECTMQIIHGVKSRLARPCSYVCCMYASVYQRLLREVGGCICIVVKTDRSQ